MSFIKRQWKRFKETAGYWLVNPLGLIFSESGRAVVNRQIADERSRKAGDITPAQRLDILTATPLSSSWLPTQTHNLQKFNASGALTPFENNAVLGDILRNMELIEINAKQEMDDLKQYFKENDMQSILPPDSSKDAVTLELVNPVDFDESVKIQDSGKNNVTVDPITADILEKTGVAKQDKTIERLTIVSVAIALVALIFKR